jgi:hypothetical protein
MSLRTQGLEGRSDRPKIDLQRDIVLQKAKSIEYCDKMINAQTKTRVDALVELEELKKASDEKWRDIYDEFYELLSDSVLEADVHRIASWGGATGAEWRRSKLPKFRDDLNKVTELMQELTESLKEGRKQKDPREYSFDGARVLKIMGASAELTVELGKLLPEIQELEKVAEAAENTLPLIRLGTTFSKVINKAAEITEIQQRRSEINDLLGNAVKGGKGLDKNCKERVDEFEREFRKLKEMVGP